MCFLKLYVAFGQVVGNKAKGESQNGCFKKAKHAKKFLSLDLDTRFGRWRREDIIDRYKEE